MTYSHTLNRIADQIYDIFDRNEYTALEVDDSYDWDNYRWTSEYFRWAHLEKFVTPKVSVLHCVVMPVSNSNAPIYGFDVIEMNGKLTGMFLDLTPVDNQLFLVPSVGEPRPKPEWGHFFSENFCCCVPQSENDVMQGMHLLTQYMSTLSNSLCNIDYSSVQNDYILGQRENPQTYRMLKSFVGEQKATEFIEQILWPVHK